MSRRACTHRASPFDRCIRSMAEDASAWSSWSTRCAPDATYLDFRWGSGGVFEVGAHICGSRWCYSSQLLCRGITHYPARFAYLTTWCNCVVLNRSKSYLISNRLKSPPHVINQPALARTPASPPPSEPCRSRPTICALTSKPHYAHKQ